MAAAMAPTADLYVHNELRPQHSRDNSRDSGIFHTTKGLWNAPGQNNCFLNSAVQMGSFNIGGILVTSPLCGEKKGVIPDAVEYMNYVLGGMTLVVSFVSIIYLIAVCMETGSTIATLFLIVTVLLLIIQLATIMTVAVAVVTYEECEILSPILLGLYFCPIWFYFIIVLRSYQEEMG